MTRRAIQARRKRRRAARSRRGSDSHDDCARRDSCALRRTGLRAAITLISHSRSSACSATAGRRANASPRRRRCPRSVVQAIEADARLSAAVVSAAPDLQKYACRPARRPHCASLTSLRRPRETGRREIRFREPDLLQSLVLDDADRLDTGTQRRDASPPAREHRRRSARSPE